jgi:hypothetical protein
MKLPSPGLVRVLVEKRALLGCTRSGEEALWNRQLERSSLRWLPAGVLAGAVAVEVARSDGAVACAESAEQRPLASPMGRTPASKLAQPTFFLSGGFPCCLCHVGLSSVSFPFSGSCAMCNGGFFLCKLSVHYSSSFRCNTISSTGQLSDGFSTD